MGSTIAHSRWSTVFDLMNNDTLYSTSNVTAFIIEELEADELDKRPTILYHSGDGLVGGYRHPPADPVGPCEAATNFDVVFYIMVRRLHIELMCDRRGRKSPWDT